MNESLAGLFVLRDNLQRAMRSIAVVAFLCVTVFYTFGIYTTYYTYCGYAAYAGGDCSLPVYKNLEKAGDFSPKLNNGERLTQTFTNQCGQLEMADVFVRAVPETSEGILKFSVLDENGQTLASQNFAAHEVPTFDYLSLPVELPPGYDNKNFVIELEAADLPPFDTFRLGGIPGDAYPGLLLLDGNPAAGDLIIHYTCAGP